MMRTIWWTPVLGALVLSACTGSAEGPDGRGGDGVDPEAARASATEYVAALDAFAAELPGVVEGWTPSWDLDDDEPADPSWADALAAAPQWQDMGEVDEPYYTAVREVAAVVDDAVVEMAALEAFTTTSDPGLYESYQSMSDVLFDAGIAMSLATSESLSTDLSLDEIRVDLNASMIEEIDAMVAAWEEYRGVYAAYDPGHPIGASYVAFVLDEIDRILPDYAMGRAFLAEVPGAEYDMYAHLFHYSGLYDSTQFVVYEYMDELSGSYAELIGELAASVPSEAASAPPSDLPSAGDPYRDLLEQTYRDFADIDVSQRYAADRLWMLWRIAEIEDIDPAAYAEARETLALQFNSEIENFSGEAVISQNPSDYFDMLSDGVVHFLENPYCIGGPRDEHIPFTLAAQWFDEQVGLRPLPPLIAEKTEVMVTTIDTYRATCAKIEEEYAAADLVERQDLRERAQTAGEDFSDEVLADAEGITEVLDDPQAMRQGMLDAAESMRFRG